jgi:hypothetical protein
VGPHPDRRREILERDDHADEPVRLLRIVGRPQLQHHLLFRSEVELLKVDALVEVPDVQLVTVLAGEEQLGVDAVLHHVRRAPFGGDHGVVPEVPPEVVRQVLRPALLLPLPLQLERLGIHQEDAAGAVAAGRPERAPVHAVGTAVNRVRRRVSRLADEFLGLDDLHDFRLLRVGLRVEDVDPRRPDAGHDQVAPLDVGVRGLRAQAGAAGVPAEVVQLVVATRKIHLADELAVGGGPQIEVDDAHRVVAAGLADVEQRDVGEPFRRGAHRHDRRGIEAWVRTHRRHVILLPARRPALRATDVRPAPGPATFPRSKVCPSV